MDEMRLKLSTNFMKSVASKIIARIIYKQSGCKVNIQIKDLDIWVVDGDTSISVNAEAKMKSDEFNKIMKTIAKE